MPLHNFVAGESAQVAENLDANFQYLLSLVLGGPTGGVQANASAAGNSVMTGRASTSYSNFGTIVALSTMTGASGSTGINTGLGTIIASSTMTGIPTGSTGIQATAVGGSAMQGVFSGALAVGATAPSTSVMAGVPGHGQSIAGTAAGFSTMSAPASTQKQIGATAIGSSTAIANGSGSATESVPATIATSPSQTIFASPTPGTGSNTALNSFSLPTNPGTILFNGVTDTGSSRVVELYYNNHTLMYENLDGAWFAWASSSNGVGSYVSTANPFPTAATESLEGTDFITPNQIIFASPTPGTAATATQTLDQWSFNTGGQLVRNLVPDGNTSGVQRIYYHNHYLWQFNGTNWYYWVGAGGVAQTGDAAPNNNYSQAIANSPPTPAATTITLAPISNQATNTTFTVSGTYSQPSGTTIPTLQYRDTINGVTGAFSALPSTVNVTAKSFSFVHPPVASVAFNGTVEVRDATSTGITKTSNSFVIFAPNQVTLGALTIDNTTFQSGPVGTHVGNVTVQTAPPPFTGTLSCNSSNFKFNGTGSFELVTAVAALPNSSYPVILSASMPGAANSPSTLNVTLTGSAESPGATAITTIGPTIAGSNTPGQTGSTLTFALATGGSGPAGTLAVTVNGVLQTSTGRVLQLYYINHTCYQQNLDNSWWYWGGTLSVPTHVAGSAGASTDWISCSDPRVVMTLSNGATFPPPNSTTNPAGSTIDTIQFTTNPIPSVNGGSASVMNATFAITGGAQQTFFSISGTSLKTTAAMPQGAGGPYAVTITATF